MTVERAEPANHQGGIRHLRLESLPDVITWQGQTGQVAQDADWYMNVIDLQWRRRRKVHDAQRAS